MEMMSEEDGFLEELLALRREEQELWVPNPNPSSTQHHQINGSYFTTWPTLFDGIDSLISSSTDQPQTTTTSLDYCNVNPFFSGPLYDPPTFTGPGPDPIPMMEVPCKAEHSVSSGELELEMPSPCSFNIIGSSALCMEKKIIGNNNKNFSKIKKVDGQPSKNLMAERRRRKRLNDRLSMLRSVVPKISKMDRTSILSDTIDYMKELLERINRLQEEMEVGSNELNVMSIFKDEKPNDVHVRNSPKFDVIRKDLDTRVEICCAGKPGLLLSTVTTLEALGLEIQQCVISCFNDFSVQASCFEDMEHKALISSEEIKQALFRNAGYGGRCL